MCADDAGANEGVKGPVHRHRRRCGDALDRRRGVVTAPAPSTKYPGVKTMVSRGKAATELRTAAVGSPARCSTRIALGNFSTAASSRLSHSRSRSESPRMSTTRRASG